MPTLPNPQRIYKQHIENKLGEQAFMMKYCFCLISSLIRWTFSFSREIHFCRINMQSPSNYKIIKGDRFAPAYGCPHFLKRYKKRFQIIKSRFRINFKL